MSGLRFISLRAESFKKIRLAELSFPDGTSVVEVTGANSNGKSSLVEAPFWAVCGSKMKIGEPIRKGSKKAEVIVTLGRDENHVELIVTRTATPSGERLVVEPPKGSPLKSPQAVLDKLYGFIAFDPTAFERMEPKEQVAALLRIFLPDFDMESFASARKGLYEERTAVNRELKRLEGKISSYQLPAVRPQKIDVAEILSEKNAIAEAMSSAALCDEKIQTAQEALVTIGKRKSEIAKRIEELRLQEETLSQQSHIMEETIVKLREKKAGYAGIDKARLVELDILIRDSSASESVNRNFDERAKAMDEAQALSEKVESITKQIGDLDDMKSDALANAKLPIPGLSFNEETILLNGVPLSQASSSETWMVELGIQMAANPELRTIIIKDGSLLDKERRRILKDMAKENDFLVLMESVDESGTVGVYLEDGEIKAVNKS